MQGNYESVTPAELGLVDPYWNGVSVEPRASSFVISFDSMKKEIKDSIDEQKENCRKRQ
jgi:hypothetical protein